MRIIFRDMLVYKDWEDIVICGNSESRQVDEK